MAEILVLVEHVDGSVKKTALELLTLARSVGQPSAVFVGDGIDNAAATLAEYGAENIYVADAAELTGHVVAPKAELLAQLVAEKSPAAVLITSTAEGKEIAGRLAIKINSGVITDAVGISEDLVATQSIFGGSTIVHSKVTTGTPIITVRPNSAAPEAAPAAGNRADVTVALSEKATSAKIVDRVEQEKGARPELTEAAVVVSGGRGVGGAEGFEVIEKLADSSTRRSAPPRRDRRRLVPPPVPGRSDGQDRLSAAVHRQRYFRCDPAPRWDADFEDDRGREQGPRGADLRARRLRRGGRLVRRRAAAVRRDQQAQGIVQQLHQSSPTVDTAVGLLASAAPTERDE